MNIVKAISSLTRDGAVICSHGRHGVGRRSGGRRRLFQARHDPHADEKIHELNRQHDCRIKVETIRRCWETSLTKCDK